MEEIVCKVEHLMAQPTNHGHGFKLRKRIKYKDGKYNTNGFTSINY
jgi:hypothetical protein